MFIPEDYFTKHRGTKLFAMNINQKLFTKDIRNAEQQSLGLAELEILQSRG
jgi:hypothetical protein